jgi:hypothetical protein
MPKPCTNKHPNARLRIHTPAGPLHSHRDNTFTLTGASDFELWRAVMKATMATLGHPDENFQMGFWLDIINGLPFEVRKALVHGIQHGFGMVIRDVERSGDQQQVMLAWEQRFDPLVGDRKTPSGLVLPGGSGQGGTLVLPTDRE